MQLTDALILVIDTETTGPDPTEDCIVELGGAYLGGGRVLTLLRERVDPGRYIPASATHVHGIRNEDVEGAPPWRDVAPRFRAHLDADPVLVGYNILAFDGPIIQADNRRHEVAWTLPPSLDPFLFACWHHRGLRTRRLGAMCEHYGIHLAADRAHTADADSLATGYLLHAMVEAGLIPNDVDAARVEQARLESRLAAEDAQFGRYLYRDREDGVLRLGLGKHTGTALDEAEADYLKWLMGRPDLPDGARTELLTALGQTEQMGLF